ncbi:MAG: hypothetical protein ACOXZZ_06825 [Sphaerochaetaceae bacterium]|jgi:predicted RNase H-like nuclease (RuvC/YqgF family)
MSLRDIRTIAVQKMEGEVEKLEKELIKLKKTHSEKQQQLFDLAKEGKSEEVLLKLEIIQKEINELVVSIRSTDSRISKIKNRAKRLKRNG